MDVAGLCRVLEGTLSPDNAVRKSQEEILSGLVRAPGYICTLLQLIQAPEMPALGACAWGGAQRVGSA